tara:strand:+ start:215 stop:457 length:243 start_codon:yes stop_codon:yes gene_type:complete
MKNFEEALIRIEILEKENQNLRDKLYASRKSKELPEVDTLVDSTSSQNLRKIHYEAEAAMKRFTAKLRRDTKKYKKDNDG